jgi:hypothetical protein
MTDQELRQLVREAIARAGIGPSSAGSAAGVGPVLLDRPDARTSHASFTLLNLPAGDGPCIIEPAVSCNHCGYCKTYGH